MRGLSERCIYMRLRERVSKRRDRGAKDIIKRGRRDEMLVHIFERIAVAVIQIPCFRQTV